MKKMTYSEQLVGRKLPPEAKNIDVVIASFVGGDKGFCCRLTPEHRWLRPSHARARKNGWLRFTGLSFGKGMEMWELTERGREEALAAKQRVEDANAARTAWSRELMQVYRNAA